MNKIFISIFMCMLFIPFCFAGDVEEETYQGTSIEENNIYTNVNLIDENSLELQEISAENNENQIGYEFVTVEERKMSVLNRVMSMWGMIGGLFIIIFDLIKSVMYIIEIYFMFLILFQVFPNLLIRIKNSLTDWYLEKLQ